MKRRLSVTNLSSENNLPTFRLNAPVVIRAESEEVRANFGIYSHALLRIHVIEGQRSVRIASPFLSPHHTFAVMMTGAFGLNVGNWAVIDTSLTLDSVHYCTISFSKFRHCPVSTVLCHVGGQALCVEVSTGLLAC